MTYKEAVEKLEKLAAGRDWCLECSTATYLLNPHIRVYIAGIGHAESAQTYAAAIYNTEIMMGIIPVDAPPEDTEEAKP